MTDATLACVQYAYMYTYTYIDMHIHMCILISMNATVYIHKNNRAAWDSLENKSDWLNNHLKDLKTDARSPLDPQQKPIDMSQDDWDESIEGQTANAGFRFVEVDSDGMVHATKGDPSNDDNHFYFDVKFGKVVF